MRAGFEAEELLGRAVLEYDDEGVEDFLVSFDDDDADDVYELP